MSGDTTYRVECEECDLHAADDDHEAVRHWVDKHKEHTSHSVEWTHFPFPETELEQIEVRCLDCADRWVFPNERDAREFIDEHSMYTDHELTEADMNAETLEVGGFTDVSHIVDVLNGNTVEGAPFEMVVAAMTDETDMTVSQAENAIDEAMQHGEIYEPSPGHLRSV